MCSLISQLVILVSCSPVCATCVWAGVDNVRKREKPEAREMLENAGESPASSACGVRRFLILPTTSLNCFDIIFSYFAPN